MVLYHSAKTACLGKIWFSRYRHFGSRPIRELDSSNCYIFWTVWPFFIIFCIQIEKYDTFKMVQWLFWKKSYLAKIRVKGVEQLTVSYRVSKKCLFFLLFFLSDDCLLKLLRGASQCVLVIIIIIGHPLAEVSYELGVVLPSFCPLHVFLWIGSLVFSDILHEVRGP